MAPGSMGVPDVSGHHELGALSAMWARGQRYWSRGLSCALIFSLMTTSGTRRPSAQGPHASSSIEAMGQSAKSIVSESDRPGSKPSSAPLADAPGLSLPP